MSELTPVHSYPLYLGGAHFKSNSLFLKTLRSQDSYFLGVFSQVLSTVLTHVLGLCSDGSVRGEYVCSHVYICMYMNVMGFCYVVLAM